ncbi:MAG: efflux RND transporter permease subunit [bacterium]|nr:efflux RND transporter permease subunit [bacterium]
MIEFFVHRRVATTMIFAAIALMGSISLSRLKVSLFPDLEFPRLTVLTPYSNVAPEEIENLVTRPVEDAVSSINGVRKISSRSQEGLSIVEVDLEWGASLDLAVINLRQKVDLAASLLPQDAGKSILIKFDPAAAPIVTLVARPVGVSFEKLRDHLDKAVRPFLERVPGVASISILGGYRREIQVNVDSRRMFAHGLSLDQIIQSLGASNFNFPAGNVKKGEREFTVRVMGDFSNLREIEETIVSVSEAGTPIALKEIADVRDDFRERRGSTFYNGDPTVIVGIKKEPGKNTIETAENIHRSLKEINKRFARTVQFDLVQDRSVYIQNAIASVRNSALLGGFIAFFVLFLFLKDVRAALIIAASVPFAIIATFVLMFLRDISLNIMSLGGLALGVGMLVDNSIVVLESIYQQKERFPDRPMSANAINGARNVFASVTASTLTSVIVFVPIIFVSGVAGAVFRDLAFTVSFSLASSLFCALSLIPMLAAVEPQPGSRGGRAIAWINRNAEPFFEATEEFVGNLRARYVKALGLALARPGRVLGVGFLLSAIGLGLLWPIEKQLFPEVDQGEVAAVLEQPGGTSMRDAEALMEKVHEYIVKNELTVHTITNIGFDEDDLASRVKGVRKPNYSESEFYLNRDDISSPEFVRLMQHGLENIGGLKASFRIRGDVLQEVLGESGGKLLFEIESRDRAPARAIAARIYERLLASEIMRSGAITAVRSTALARDPEVRLYLDRAKIAAFGLTPEAVAGTIRTGVFGRVSTIYREGDREIDVRVRLREPDRRRTDQLHSLYVPTAGGAAIEVGDLIRPEEGLSFPTILRDNQRKIERIEVEFLPERRAEVRSVLDDLLKQASREVRENPPPELDGESPPDLRVREENQETLDSLSNLLYAFLLSSILIYMLLAGQFESVIHPITLALSIPMMLFGVSLSLLLTGHSLNITSAIGMILLVGIVVNSAIVLYEYIQQNRARYREERQLDLRGEVEALPEILAESGAHRLRPILLTTLTTILGLIPMGLGLGEGGDLQAPMAIVVIGGLLVSSVLTLIAFPTLYYVFERMRVSGNEGENSHDAPALSTERDAGL